MGVCRKAREMKEGEWVREVEKKGIGKEGGRI